MVNRLLLILICLFGLGACASKLKDQLKDYRSAFEAGEFQKASEILQKSLLKKQKKSALLWQLEAGTAALTTSDVDSAIKHFQASLSLIDKLYTTKLSAKAASLFINDASDEFYGASYERSYAHYYLSRAYYARYQKTKNPLDLQGARATILAWDSYFAELQRSATVKTLYHTDLMLKIFGGEVHEVSEIRNDKQISLQLYKDALKILDHEGGIFSLFNKKSLEYIKDYEVALKKQATPSTKFFEKTEAYADLKDFIQYKILSLTQELRPGDYQVQLKSLAPASEVLHRLKQKRPNVVLILEEGMIPSKKGQPFNFGIKGALNAVKDPTAKAFIATVGVESLTIFAMNKLGMIPTETANPGSFIFAHDVTRLAVQEAAVEFELPMIENVPLVQRLQLFVLDDKGVVVASTPIPVVSENGDIARVVLEEDVVSRYVKTGSRVAVRHIMAIIAAMEVYRQLDRNNAGDFLAKSAALATYVGSAKGIAALEKADTRHWSTLPQALRITELSLPPGKYKVSVASYTGSVAPKTPAAIIGDIQVDNSGKALHTIRFNSKP
jgi:hypothetical protein